MADDLRRTNTLTCAIPEELRMKDELDIIGRPIPQRFYSIRPEYCQKLICTENELFTEIQGWDGHDDGEFLVGIVRMTWAEYYELQEFQGF